MASRRYTRRKRASADVLRTQYIRAIILSTREELFQKESIRLLIVKARLTLIGILMKEGYVCELDLGLAPDDGNECRKMRKYGSSRGLQVTGAGSGKKKANRQRLFGCWKSRELDPSRLAWLSWYGDCGIQLAGATWRNAKRHLYPPGRLALAMPFWAYWLLQPETLRVLLSIDESSAQRTHPWPFTLLRAPICAAGSSSDGGRCGRLEIGHCRRCLHLFEVQRRICSRSHRRA